MADMKRPPRSTEDILREMAELSRGIEASENQQISESRKSEEKHAREGGALKSLLGFFVKVHDDEAPPPPNPKGIKGIPAQPVTGTHVQTTVPEQPKRVADLVANEPLPQFIPPKATQIPLSEKPFEDIYREAGINSSVSVDHLLELMNSPTVQNQPMAVKVVAVNLALSAKGEKIDDYIADAVRKDRAIDAYQKMLSQRARDIEEKTKKEIERIQKEVEEYLKKKQAEIESLRAQATDCNKQSIDFSVRRLAEEQRLADAISPFLEGKPNPVTVGNDPDQPELTSL